MLQGINIFDFFESINSRRWNNADIKEYCVVFATGFVPPFIVVKKTTATQALVKLINEVTGEEEISWTVSMNDSDEEDYKILTFVQKTLADKECGYYSFEVTVNTKTYYSEVFGWSDNLSKLAKFEVYSESVTFAGVHELPMASISNTFYLFQNGSIINAEIPEDGVEKPYGDIPLFNTLNILRTISINGTNQIFRYLSALRVLHVNGQVDVTIDNEKRQIYDIRCEVDTDNSFGIYVQINFIYKEIDFVSVRNEI